MAAIEANELCSLYKKVFALRNGGEKAVPLLQDLFHTTHSTLLRHEVAYALGQMRHAAAVPFLETLLADDNEHPVTRHEAAEALAAIGNSASRALLQRHADDERPEVAETCALALRRLDHHELEKGACACEAVAQRVVAAEERLASPSGEGAPPLLSPSTPPPSSFASVDPAPAAEMADIGSLAIDLANVELPLFERYGALFALRNLATAHVSAEERDGAVQAICKLLRGEKEGDSALLRHEVAFVLGQLENIDSVETLCGTVRDEEEHAMVRHEAAEALGAIGSSSGLEVLRAYADHSEPLLRDSCVVALHMYDRDAFLAAGVCV